MKLTPTRLLLLILCIITTSTVNAEKSKPHDAFSVYPLSNERMSRVLHGDGRDFYVPSSTNKYKTGFQVSFPDGVTKKGFLIIFSAKTQQILYRSSYTENQSIVFDADYRLLDQEGFDFLRIEYYDFEKKLTYICEQQKIFKLWEVGSIVTINILTTPKEDEQVEGTSYCYEANIYKKNNQA